MAKTRATTRASHIRRVLFMPSILPYACGMKKTFVPEGWPRIIPRLFVNDGRGLVDFVKRVFDAEGEYLKDRPSEITLGDSRMMIADAGEVRPPTTAFLYVYVPDADATYRRAIELGAQSIEPPAD